MVRWRRIVAVRNSGGVQRPRAPDLGLLHGDDLAQRLRPGSQPLGRQCLLLPRHHEVLPDSAVADVPASKAMELRPHDRDVDSHHFNAEK